MSIYEVREYKESIEEALEALWNNRQETFRDIIYGLLSRMEKELEDYPELKQHHPYVEVFNCPELKHLNDVHDSDAVLDCKRRKQNEKMEESK